MATRARSARNSRKLAWNKERTEELFRRFKEEGDLEARQELIESHINLVHFYANKFNGRGEPIDDLVQVGYVGLIKAIDRFDPSMGNEFTTFATPTIVGEIKRYFRDKGWSVRVPRRLQELSSKINRAKEELSVELQRAPSVEEIASYVDSTVDEVLEAMESSEAYNSVPLEASPDDEEGPGLSHIDKYESVDRDLRTADLRLDLQESIKDLPEREQKIIHLSYGEGLTQKEIAAQLDISQVQVSRILRKTLAQLRKKIDPSQA